MKDYIFNTTNEKIDTSEMDKVINFACKKMGVINPLLNIVLVDNKKIQEINKEGQEFIKNVIEDKTEYYVSNDKNNPFIYKDKNCTDMVYGAYRSIRKKTVIDGQILYNSIYCIKGES